MKIKFRSKIFLAITCINIIVTVIISLCFYKTSENFLEENFLKSLSSHNNTIVKNIDDIFKKAYYTTNLLSVNTELKENINNYLMIKKTNRQIERNILSILQQYKNENDMVDSVYIFLPRNKQIYTEKDWISFHRNLTAYQYKFLIKLLDKNKLKDPLEPLATTDIVNASHKKIFTYIKPIFIDNVVKGWIFVNLDERNIYYKYLDSFLKYDNIGFYLLDSDYNVISEKKVDSKFNTKLFKGDIKNNFKDKNYLITDKKALFSNYHTILVIDKKMIMNKLILLQYSIMGLAVVIILLSFIAAYYMAQKVNKPVEKLEKAMVQVSKGDFRTQVSIEGNDEISRVGIGFNNMTRHINQLIEQIILEKTLKKEAELKALQYQITPHFIYNTLNSIRFAAIMQGAKNIGKLLEMFIQLLQVSSDKKGSFITVEEEIITLKNYIKLQQFRHGNNFSISYDIDNEVMKYVVPKLILQPLLENSIVHGPSEEKKDCSIRIKISHSKDKLILIVEDNGKGVSLDKIKKIQETGALSGDHYNHIGIKNIKDRLNLYYKEEGKIEYESDGKTYTRAIITIPISENKEKYYL